MSDDIERMIAAFEAAIRQKPNYSYLLVGLAEIVAAKKHELRAVQIAHRAMAMGDPAAIARGRALLASMIPGYHVPMMNDERRKALSHAALRLSSFIIGT